jgi:hypothetical protein
MQPWELDAQPLPFTTPPVAGETTTSYLLRLAEINNWSKDALLDHITAHHLPGNRTQPDWDCYDLVLNHPAARDLAPRPRRQPHPTDPRAGLSPLYIFESHPHPTADLPTGGPALCPRHWLWLADQPHGRPTNLATQPDLLRAAKRHLRIRAQRGVQPTAAAVNTATGLWFRYRKGAAVPNPLQQRWADRRATLASNLHGHVLITHYPEIITLAAMITSPYWFAAVMRPHHPPRSSRRWIPRIRPDERDFYVELARRVQLPDTDQFGINPGNLRTWTIHTRQKAQVN